MEVDRRIYESLPALNIYQYPHMLNVLNIIHSSLEP